MREGSFPEWTETAVARLGARCSCARIESDQRSWARLFLKIVVIYALSEMWGIHEGRVIRSHRRNSDWGVERLAHTNLAGRKAHQSKPGRSDLLQTE